MPIQKNSVEYIRTVLDSHIGERITVKANEGRKRISITEGVLERTYPSIFTVRVDDEYGRTATWSYVDVLTDSVEIKFGDDAQDVPADN
ncbi:MAG TPA: Veg family protein [Bacillota bacterium]|nr:Veg family protein [Bacillota bacterium]HOK64717.1 Veg family protein [Bacillota bacterium]HOL12272.1 Veg family protein [Bacillota bacterium]HOQ03346.1 Veg family protein [Bacillota bacterium]HPP61106.1 Veg family protein [Bacillota bacterium]